MASLSVGVFHDIRIASELGKKDSRTDIEMFSRKAGDSIITLMQPVDGKLSAKCQIMSVIDAAIVSLMEVTPEVGETILMLDSLGVSRGIIIAEEGSPVNELTKGTSLERFLVMGRDPARMMEELMKMDPERDTSSPALVVADQSFSVKGVGEVVLGMVKRGAVRKHDKLSLMPGGKEVIVRSIQVHDKDVDEASAGIHAGLCIKGATSDEVKRGSVLCSPGSCLSASRLRLSFRKSRFWPEVKEGAFHASVGMQTFPVKVSEVSESSITVEAERPFAYSKGDVFLLLDINARKLRLIGSGKAE
jgi:selenocysteine-specific translation elongation factor